MQHCWNDTNWRKMNYPVTKPVQVPLCQPQIPWGLNAGLRDERSTANCLSKSTFSASQKAKFVKEVLNNNCTINHPPMCIISTVHTHTHAHIYSQHVKNISHCLRIVCRRHACVCQNIEMIHTQFAFSQQGIYRQNIYRWFTCLAAIFPFFHSTTLQNHRYVPCATLASKAFFAS